MVDSKPSHECQRHMANWKESQWKCQGKDQQGSGASVESAAFIYGEGRNSLGCS